MRSGIQINSENTERQLVADYINGMKATDLMKKYGYKTKKSIYDKVRKYEGENFDFETVRKSRKTYSLDFTTIKNPFDAYFIGLMVTDGYVIDERKFGIELTDEDCVAFISAGTGQIYNTYEPTISGNLKRHRIIFSDKENIKQLERYGIIKNKSKILTGFDFLPAEEQFIPYFIRGVIDGDGTIGYTSYGEKYFSICSASLDHLNWLASLMINKLYMYQFQNHYTNINNVHSISSALKRNTDILKLLVYDQPFGMMRKYNILHEQASETIMGTSNKMDDGIVQPTIERV